MELLTNIIYITTNKGVKFPLGSSTSQENAMFIKQLLQGLIDLGLLQVKDITVEVGQEKITTKHLTR